MKLMIRLYVVSVFALLLTGCFGGDDTEIKYQNETVEELYEKARVSLATGSWNTALERLRSLEARFPYGPYAEQAQLDTIYAYYQLGRTESAITAADRFIGLYPTNQSVDYAYYMKGLASYLEDDSVFGRFKGINDISDRDPNNLRRSLAAFQDVYTLFPDSQYAPDSRRRVQYLLESIARNEIAIANYYYTQEAYVAVVNRAKVVVEGYSSTPYVEVALAMTMFSYEHMGFDDLSADTRAVLELNFPDSKYLSKSIRTVNFENEFNAKSSTRNSRDDEEAVDSGTGLAARFSALFSKSENEEEAESSAEEQQPQENTQGDSSQEGEKKKGKIASFFSRFKKDKEKE